MKQLKNLMLTTGLVTALSGCAHFEWLVYKIDVPQGNYIEQNQVEKLRINMTKEQIEFVLGRPILRDTFSDDTWYYIYQFKNGEDGKITNKELIVHFKDNRVQQITGDYSLSNDFLTPLN